MLHTAHLFQLRFSAPEEMTSSFAQRFVFGLLVLCVFQSTEAHFKVLPKQSSPATLRQRQSLLPSTSRTLDLHRQPPSHAQRSSTNSMSTVNLHSSDSSASDIYRSASSPTLNKPNSPVIMQDVDSLHRHAASSLNMRTLNIHRENTLLQRLRPSPERMISIGKYIKNGAIATAGTGGVIIIANVFQSNSGDSNSERIPIVNITTTTTEAPEIDNRIGTDK